MKHALKARMNTWHVYDHQRALRRDPKEWWKSTHVGDSERYGAAVTGASVVGWPTCAAGTGA